MVRSAAEKLSSILCGLLEECVNIGSGIRPLTSA